MIDALRAGWALDGAIGTELVSRGAEPADPEAWVVSRPEVVVGLHRAMLEAGACAVTAASFSAPRAGGEGERRVRLAVEVARRAGAPLVMASLGPGANHAALAEAAVDAGADAVLLETFVDLGELASVVGAVLDRVDGQVPVIAGHCPLELAPAAGLDALPARLADLGAAAFMVGCGDGQGSVSRAAKSLAGGALPVIARPSAGMPGQVRTARELGTIARELRDAGVIAMGACCGGGPSHVRAIAEAATP